MTIYLPENWWDEIPELEPYVNVPANEYPTRFKWDTKKGIYHYVGGRPYPGYPYHEDFTNTNVAVSIRHNDIERIFGVFLVPAPIKRTKNFAGRLKRDFDPFLTALARHELCVPRMLVTDSYQIEIRGIRSLKVAQIIADILMWEYGDPRHVLIPATKYLNSKKLISSAYDYSAKWAKNWGKENESD